MEQQSPEFFRQGPTPATRLTFFMLLSLLFLVSDAHYKYLETLRKAVATVIYPLQRVARAPAAFIDYAGGFIATQSELVDTNRTLARQYLKDQAQLLRFAALQAENDQLRKLLDATRHLSKPLVMAEILYTQRDPFSRKIIVDKGSQQQVEAGSAVIDASGVIGQVMRVNPFSSEISLITDKDQTTPVQVLRNGLRAILFGYGSENLLDLRYMSPNIDIQPGDTLVTSGIDGTYPSGLPVAIVSKVERNPAYAFAKITCIPAAGVDRNREVLILNSPHDPRSDTPFQSPQKGK